MYYVGIDWADQKHDFAIINEQNNLIVKPTTIKKSYLGFEKLLKILRALDENPPNFKLGIETPHNLIVDFLVDLGYPVFVLFPGVMKDLRRRYRASGAHDDRFDALVIADALRTEKVCWRQLTLGSELARKFSILARDHHSMVQSQAMLITTLRTTLNLYYPEYIHFFSNVACKTSLAFLLAYPDFERAKKLTPEQLGQFFKEHNYRNKKAIDKTYNILQKPHLAVAKAVIETKKLKALTVATILQQMATVIERYIKELTELLQKHPDTEIFLSYPGSALVNAARLISIFGDDRSRFSAVSEVRALSGTSPVTDKSGKNHKGVIYFRRACNKYYRDVIHQLAFSSLKPCPWAKAYYQKHRAWGKKHNHALRCLANMHLKILYVMWKNRTLYDENLFLAQRARHQFMIVNTRH
jgi:transposase